MRNWLNVELTSGEAIVFTRFLRNNSIKYESSECYNLVHIEVYVNQKECDLCDNFLANL